MWITQTYLGEVEPNADVFIYYFFEDYVDDQSQLTKKIQTKLEDLGTLFGSRVSLLMPNPRYAITIKSELRDKFQDFWWSFAGKLPGLFVSTAPLPKLSPRSDQGHFFSFAGKSPTDVSKVIERVREVADGLLKSNDLSPQAPQKQSSFAKLVDAIEAKPGFAGFRLDLKRLFAKNG